MQLANMIDAIMQPRHKITEEPRGTEGVTNTTTKVPLGKSNLAPFRLVWDAHMHCRSKETKMIAGINKETLT